MSRRTTVNRTHRTVRRKEAKTIQDARDLIIAMVPIGCRIHIWARWFDVREHGSAYTTCGYECTIYREAPTGDPRQPPRAPLVDAQAPTPAGLVAAIYKQLQEPRKPAPPSKSLVPVKPPLEGEIVEDEPEYQSSSPRPGLPARQRPLLAYGAGS